MPSSSTGVPREPRDVCAWPTIIGSMGGVGAWHDGALAAERYSLDDRRCRCSKMCAMASYHLVERPMLRVRVSPRALDPPLVIEPPLAGLPQMPQTTTAAG